jgi:hypothetical protein
MGVYRKHYSIIIAVDFDDTIYNYSGQDFDVDYVIDLIKQCQLELGAKVILFTCRENELLEAALKYCSEKDLYIDRANTSLENYEYPSRKPFYNILLDDKACLPEACAALETVLDWKRNHYDY